MTSWLLGCIEKYGKAITTVIVAIPIILVSIAIKLIDTSVFGHDLMPGLYLSSAIPAIVAPPAIYLFLVVVVRLDQLEKEAERANAAKSRFLAAASHDLRQPLQSATLYIDTLSELDDDPKRSEIIKKTMASLEVTADILNALLDVSKLDAGLVTPDLVEFQVSDIFNRISDIEPIAARKGLKFKVVDSDARLHTDPALFEAIIRNILNNAVKYTEKGGVLLGVRNSARKTRIEVWDTGPGIPAGQLGAIFEEFYQVNNPQRDREQGLGLGLSIVRRLTDILGGELDVRSNVGRGTVMSITLPAIVPH